MTRCGALRLTQALAAALIANGCIRASDPLAGPPAPNTETLDRVRHAVPAALPPVGTEAGNLWPGPSEHVPTMLDMLQQQPAVARAAVPRHRGGAFLCQPAAVGYALGLCYRQ